MIDPVSKTIVKKANYNNPTIVRTNITHFRLDDGDYIYLSDFSRVNLSTFEIVELPRPNTIRSSIIQELSDNKIPSKFTIFTFNNLAYNVSKRQFVNIMDYDTGNIAAPYYQSASENYFTLQNGII